VAVVLLTACGSEVVPAPVCGGLANEDCCLHLNGGFGSLASSSEAGPGVHFTDVTTALGLPEIAWDSASWADVNGDRYPDLLVAGATTGELFLNCGDRFVPLGVGLDRDDIRAATAIADVDEDGDVDLVMAQAHSVRIYWQQPSLTFAGELVWSSQDNPPYAGESNAVLVDDLDFDGRLDLYVSRTDFSGPTTVARGRASNPLLSRSESGALQDRGLELGELTTQGQFLSYAASVIPEVAGDGRWLYLARDAVDDALFRASTEEWTLVEERIAGTSTSMGVDFTYLDDSGVPLVALSQTGGFPMGLIGLDGSVELLDSVDSDADLNHWGILFADLDLDGLEDLVYAAGIPTTGEARGAALWGGTELDTRLLLLEAAHTADDLHFRDVSEAAGELFDGSATADYFSLSSADFDRDGCPDLAVSPSPIEDVESGSRSFNTTLRLLRNDCVTDSRWFGVDLPDAIGAVVAAHLSDGDRAVTRYRAIKGASSVGSRSHAATISFGLGELDLERVTIRCPGGEIHDVDGDDLSVGAYTDLRHLGCRRAPSP